MRIVIFIAFILCSLGLNAQQGPYKVKYIHGTPSLGKVPEYNQYGQLQFKPRLGSDIDGYEIVERWASFDSTAFDSTFLAVDTFAVPASWGLFGVPLEVTWIWSSNDSIPTMIPFEYDNFVHTDTAAAHFEPHFGQNGDTWVHNMDDNFTLSNMFTLDGEEVYLLRIKFIRRETAAD